jgi:LPXTG-motif cell wall-anchored protein
MSLAGEIITSLLAMTPIGELRLAIPIGLTVYNLSPLVAYFVSVSGNILAVFLILVFLGAFSRWSSRKISFFNSFWNWLFSKTRENHFQSVNKYGLYVLPLFVAIPLPITGGWTASLIAFVFGMPFKKAFPLISFGVLIAGIIVLFLTRAGIVLEKNFGWQALIGLLFVSGVSYWLYKKKKNNYH